MLLGMSIVMWLPWFFGIVILAFTWWLGIVYWGKYIEDEKNN